MRMDKGKPFMDIEADDGSAPTFSEGFLYPTVGKGDARFILGVADEYAHVIDALGPKAVCLILDVKPRLAQRLGLPGVVIECLDDAMSDEARRREDQFPSQVILDEDAAHSIWQLLHTEYRRLFNPEESMDRDTLRAYNTLTDALGSPAQEQRQQERDRLPEKLEKQAERKAQLTERREARLSKRERIQRVIERVDGEPIDVADAIERELRDEEASVS